MTNDHDYGEPWCAGDFGHIITGNGAETELVAACNMWEPKYRNRILKCVNAMAGLKPAKVRDLIMDLRINDLDEETGSVCPCSSEDCWPCRARACFYEEGES